MAWTHISDSTVGTGTAAVISSTLGTFAVGDLLLVAARDRTNAALALPGNNYVELGGATVYQKIWGKYMSAAEPNPSLSAVGFTVLLSAVFRWGGGTAPALTPNAAIVLNSSEAPAFPTTDIPYNSAAVPAASCLNIGFGSIISDSTTIDAAPDFPSRSVYYHTASPSISCVFDYAIQTTAVNISSSFWNVNGGVSNNSSDALVLVLGPGTTAPAGASLTPRKRFRFYDTFIPRRT